ncbi:MAG: serine/threonine-protein kinase [Candidatus Binatia bacterium]
MAEAILGKMLGGKYRLLSVLGEGAMGVVYRAEQLDVTGHPLREVALKTLRRELSADHDFARRFLDEVRVVAQLRSPHVVMLHDVGSDEEGGFYYTMELVRGDTLKDLLRRNGPLAVPHAVHLTGQVCEALSEAHGLPNPIVHRDLKPANIFVEKRRGEDWAKVGDFGIAKVIGEQATRLTAVGTSSPGTPRYMAPEQWKGEEVSNRTDLYALGCMLYELLNGNPPFAAQGGGIQSLMYQHLTQPPPPLPPTIPPAIRSMVERLLAKEPADRPQDALTVSQALESALREREEKTVILKGAEDEVTELLASSGKGLAQEEQPMQVVPSLAQPERDTVPAPGALVSPREPTHQEREIAQARKRWRLVAVVVMVLGLSAGGSVLLNEGGWEKYWPSARIAQPLEASKENEGTQPLQQDVEQKEPSGPATDVSIVAKSSDSGRGNQDTAGGTPVSAALSEKRLPSDLSASSSSLPTALDEPGIEPQRPSPLQGSLSVLVNVESAKVSLNGEYVGTARGNSPLEIPQLAVGQQQVRVEAEGYEALEHNANVQKGKVTKLEFTLSRAANTLPTTALPEPSDRTLSSPSPTSDAQRPSRPVQEDEKAPAVIFYGPDGKPIPQSQIERQGGLLGNRQNRAIAPLSAVRPRLRDRRRPPGFPQPRLKRSRSVLQDRP